MSESTSPGIEAQLRALRNLFRQRLDEELPELEQLAQNLEHQDEQGERLLALRRSLHNMAGSAGTFGYSSLGKLARGLEIRVAAWLDGGSVSPDEARSFSQDIQGLRREVDVQDTDPNAGQSQPAPVDDPRTEKNGQVVCLVEDDESLAEELIRVFGHFGYQVSHHSRLTDAASVIEQRKPDILIMDVVFHEDGLNSIEHVALHPVFQELDRPIIFLSDQDDFKARFQAARIGAEGFFLKPLDVPKLIDRLEQSLRQRHTYPCRLLVVDDDVELSQRYTLILRDAGMEVKAVNNPEKVLDVLSEFHPELILMDLSMPGYSGTDLTRMIRMHDEWLSLPIVYLSAETDLDKQLLAMSKGGDDFLTKPISDRHLVAAVSVRVARMRQLNELMTKDSLTGLLKHSRIKEQIALEFAKSRRNNTSLCVGMLDIDHFKTVNDTYGHSTGDQVIKALAHLLKQRLRKTDSIGRYGGEEFAVALPECDPDAAIALLDDIRTRFKEIRFSAGDQSFTVTLSAGTACAANYWDAADMLAAADDALYAAKRGGRDRVCSGRCSRGENE